MTDEFGNELADFICPICNLLYYGDKCLHRYPDIILFQAAEIERLRAALLSLREDTHAECDDCWYSCPKSGACCDQDRKDTDVCTCGVDRRNKIIDSVLKGDRP
jgi:hypothetical protein